MANYEASDYVKYGQIFGDYSYVLAQQAAPYMDEYLPDDIREMLNPGINSFSEHYSSGTRTFTIENQYGVSMFILPVAFLIFFLMQE